MIWVIMYIFLKLSFSVVCHSERAERPNIGLCIPGSFTSLLLVMDDNLYLKFSPSLAVQAIAQNDKHKEN